MHRLTIDPRRNWQAKVEDSGLHHHTLDGEPYWDESAAYQLSPYEVDQLELAADSVHAMCLEVCQRVVDDRLLGLLLIPEEYQDFVAQSWNASDFSIYGRFDFAYDGVGPPKLLEYNADTPTALVEASVTQWHWLKEVDERGDQFNSIHERLIEGWQTLREIDPRPIHFAAMGGQIEDYVTAEYLRDTAIQAGFETFYLDIEQIGLDSANHTFLDPAGRPIEQIFKLYPWEWMAREDYGPAVLRSRTRFIEPPWKMLLSNKAILPLLYGMFPESPFLLPASFSPLDGPHVRKPIHSREGANITLFEGSRVVSETDGVYGDGPFVYQAIAPMKPHDGRYPVYGTWVVNGVACGLGIREDTGIITRNTSRFIPHQMTN